MLAVTLGLLAALDWGWTLPRLVRSAALPIVALGAVAVGAAALWRGRSAASFASVALWLEQRSPALRYALVTLADARVGPGPHVAELEARVAAVPMRAVLLRGIGAALLWPAALAAGAAAVLSALPPAAVARVSRPRPGDVLDAARRAGDGAAALSPLTALVTPPAYSGARPFRLEEPASIAALTGSAVELRGPGAAARLVARLGDDTLVAGPERGRWVLRFPMPSRALALRLDAGAASRLVTIEPVPDSVPQVLLTLPARDSVLRRAAGPLPLAADVTDDIGLTAAWFEFIVSSGERESYTFRAGSVGRVRADGGRATELRASLPFDSLRLRPGDVVHLRAVATDNNAVAGPGQGVSQTRTFRVARAGDYDSLTLDIPPYQGDTAALSQRMLILMAEALERRRPRLERAGTVRESQDIGRDQVRLRRRVAEIVFARLEGEEGEDSNAPDGLDAGAGERRQNLSPDSLLAAAESAGAAAVSGEALDFASDESPVVAINRPLLEAYNAMWEAGRWLEIGEPDDALPFMRAALAAIQRARQAERLYLRGRPPAAVVDLAAVRLAGNRADARSGVREGRTAPATGRARLAERFDAALRLLPGGAGAAVDSLLMLRLDALERHPPVAAALARAIADLRAGRDATSALVRARTAITGEPRGGPGLGGWETAP